MAKYYRVVSKGSGHVFGVKKTLTKATNLAMKKRAYVASTSSVEVICLDVVSGESVVVTRFEGLAHK